ncbi:unnamed protein product [Cylindrotheca closterium]|uniref:Uncharacterized protein n=1 Tax=Cylindrotheca closterium TaxID=2856 RepID=A0AAD2CDG5_9STRA|nr:unnamed protein product [Cylindrotheca closterium]
MDFTREYTAENMFRDYLGVHPNHFRGDNESQSTQHTQKTKGGNSSIVDPNEVIGSHRGNSSPKKNNTVEQQQTQQQSKQQSKQQSQQPQQSKSQTRSINKPTIASSNKRQRRSTSLPQHERLQKQPSGSTTTTTASSSNHSPLRKVSSTIGQSTAKFIGYFDGVCVSVGDWWGEHCHASMYESDDHHHSHFCSGKRRSKDRRSSSGRRGRSRTSRPRDAEYYANKNYADDDDTFGTYSDGSATDDSYSFDDATYDSYDDQFLSRDHERRRRSQSSRTRGDTDDESLDSLERGKRWREAKKQQKMEQQEAQKQQQQQQQKQQQPYTQVELDNAGMEFESTIARQRRLRMEQERIAIEQQRQHYHDALELSSSKALSAVSSGRRTTVSQAHTEVIHNTLRRQIHASQQQQHQQQQQQQYLEYENVDGGATEWPQTTMPSQQGNVDGGSTTEWPQTSSSSVLPHQQEAQKLPQNNALEETENDNKNEDGTESSSDDDEAQRAFDWIHDPTKREQAWAKATDESIASRSLGSKSIGSRSQSIESRSVRSPSNAATTAATTTTIATTAINRSQDESSVRSIPFDQAKAEKEQQQQQKVGDGSSLQSKQHSSLLPPSTADPHHMPSQHWKKMDDKVQAERKQLQAKHELEAAALLIKKQEQDELLQQRLKMFGPSSGDHSMNLNLSAIPTDGSEHDHQTLVLQHEQHVEVNQKEHELELLQGAIHKRLALSPSAQERKEKRLQIQQEIASKRLSVQEKEQEWLEAFKKRQAEIQREEELLKKQLDETIQASNSLPLVPTTTRTTANNSNLDSSSSLKSNGSSSSKSTEAKRPVVKFASAQDGVPRLPPSLDSETAPPAKTREEHKQQITSSFDSEDQASLEPNPRLKPIQCKVERRPASPAVDEKREKQLIEQRRMREEFKASRLAALGGSSTNLIIPGQEQESSSNSKKEEGDGDAKSKASKDDSKSSSQDSPPSMLQQNELTLGSQSFSNMDDISVLTPTSTKTMETTQTTQTAKSAQTNASKKSTSISLPSKGSSRTPIMPPSMKDLQGGKKRGESARLAAKRKELEWMWNAAKVPLEQLEEEQRLKQKKNKVKKLTIASPPGGLGEASVGSNSTGGSSKKRVVEYAPGVTPVDRMPAKVWTKKKGGSVTTTTTASTTTSSEADDNRRDLLLDKPPPKNRVSQLVKKQRELSERHRRNSLLRDGRRSPSVSVVPEEASVVTKEAMSVSSENPNVSFSTQTCTAPTTDEMNMVTPEKDTIAPSPTIATGFDASPSQKAPIVTPENKKSPSRVMNFWEQKEQEQLAKKAQEARHQKRESWNVKTSPSKQVPAPVNVEKPLSKIELKRRELAAKREAFQKQKEEASKRVEQELGFPGSETNLNDFREEQKKVDAKELVSKFEELKVVLSSSPSSAKETQPEFNDGFGAVIRRPPSHRCLADRKQRELDRRNQEYLQSLNQFGRSTSQETNSSTAWPDMEPPRRYPLQAKSRVVEEEDVQSNESVPEKEITRNQQLRQAWRQRAWKTLDNKVDGDGFPTLASDQLGTKAVQKVLGKNNRLAMLTEQY